MTIAARFGHVNLIARDWRRLAAFYERELGCVPVPPERDLSGPLLEAGTGIPGARLRGLHLRLPGLGDAGPTLEIFEYDPPRDGDEPRLDRPGFAHLAFVVDDVEAARASLLAAGARAVGEVVTFEIGTRAVTWCYLRDPEGNLLELQRWTERA